MISALFESDTKRYIRNFRDARGYHLRAIQFAEAQQRPSLIFNVASIAIECYLIALCAYYKVMPTNHNYINLMEDAERVVTFPAELSASIRSLDEIFGICSLENYHHGNPGAEDAARVLVMCEQLLQLFDQLAIRPAETHSEKREA